MSYYRNGTFVDRECVYSVTVCKQEYLVKYPDLQIQETSLEAHIKNAINRFVWIGGANKGKSPGRPSVSENVVTSLKQRLQQNPQIFFDNIVSAVRSSCEHMSQSSEKTTAYVLLQNNYCATTFTSRSSTPRGILQLFLEYFKWW